MQKISLFVPVDLERFQESCFLPLASSSISAGFPSPAEDHIEDRLDLNRHLIKNPIATFFFNVSGDSMIEAGIYDGDLLIVDRTLSAHHNNIVVAVLNDEMLVKYFIVNKNTIYLRAANSNFSDRLITDKDKFSLWGVVTYVIRSVRS